MASSELYVSPQQHPYGCDSRSHRYGLVLERPYVVLRSFLCFLSSLPAPTLSVHMCPGGPYVWPPGLFMYVFLFGSLFFSVCAWAPIMSPGAPGFSVFSYSHCSFHIHVPGAPSCHRGPQASIYSALAFLSCFHWGPLARLRLHQPLPLQSTMLSKHVSHSHIHIEQLFTLFIVMPVTYPFPASAHLRCIIILASPSLAPPTGNGVTQ